MTKEEKLILLPQIFTPISPVKEMDFFHGRISQLKKIVDAINEKGQHVILYGERGVGKTSLANIMTKHITNIYPVKVTCNTQDNFKTLWTRALNEIKFSKTTSGLGFKPSVNNEIIKIGEKISNIALLQPSHIEEVLKQLAGFTILFVFDEFDNIDDQQVRQSFADLIKSLSDNNLNTTIVLVGIAENVETLIGSHQSLERCLKQVKMPRMSKEESVEIIESGLKKLELDISQNVRNNIVDFSSGFPHYIHLLCRHGAKEIIDNNKTDFSSAYLTIAIRSGIENTSEQLRSSFKKAILSSSSILKWQNLLYACANAKLDEFNTFSISEIVNQYNKICGASLKSSSLNYNINQLTSDARGSILTKIGKGQSTRYTFKNPMMRAYIKLKINSKDNL